MFYCENIIQSNLPNMNTSYFMFYDKPKKPAFSLSVSWILMKHLCDAMLIEIFKTSLYSLYFLFLDIEELGSKIIKLFYSKFYEWRNFMNKHSPISMKQYFKTIFLVNNQNFQNTFQLIIQHITFWPQMKIYKILRSK